jgi:hypothetical protein
MGIICCSSRDSNRMELDKAVQIMNDVTFVLLERVD